MGKKPKIAALDTTWAHNEARKAAGKPGAIAYYRLYKPLECLKDDFEIDFWGKELERFGDTIEAYPYLAKNYDLILSKHLDNGNAASQLLAMANHFKKKVIVDLDDNYLQIRKDNPAASDYDKFKGGRYWLGAFLSLSNGLFVSTDPLKKVYGDYLGQFPTSPIDIDVLPNCFYLDDWNFPRTQGKDKWTRIHYAGSITHDDDLDIIYEPIGRILEKYPHVRFEVSGAVKPENIGRVAGKIQSYCNRDLLSQMEREEDSQLWFFGGNQYFEPFPKQLASFGIDIGIAPLVDEPFNQCKSHIKWLEYTMVGAATIASQVYPYYQPIHGVETITHDRTGLLAKTKEDWFPMLEDLVLNTEHRKQLAQASYEHILANWQYKQHAFRWKEALLKYL